MAASVLGVDLVEIGVLGRPHGILGEIRVQYYAESVDLLYSGQVYLKTGNYPPRKVVVASVRVHQCALLLRFEGVSDRAAAELLRGQILLVADAALPDVDEDEVYLHAMLGLSVLLDADGSYLGTLDQVLFHGEQELWSILTPDGREVLFPAVPEFVPDIDLETKRIRIAPPDGLLELYLGPSL